MGPEASATLNLEQAATFLGEALGVPSDLIRKTPRAPLENIINGKVANAQIVQDA